MIIPLPCHSQSVLPHFVFYLKWEILKTIVTQEILPYKSTGQLKESLGRKIG